MRIRTVVFVLTVLSLVVMMPPGAAAQGQKEDQKEDQKGDPTKGQEQDTSSPSLRIDWTEFKKRYDAKAIEVVDVRGKVETGKSNPKLQIPNPK
jgi:hypothetical protein